MDATPWTALGEEIEETKEGERCVGINDGIVLESGDFIRTENLPIEKIKSILTFLAMGEYLPKVEPQTDIDFGQAMLNSNKTAICWKGGFSYEKAIAIGNKLLNLNFDQSDMEVIEDQHERQTVDGLENAHISFGEFELSVDGMCSGLCPKQTSFWVKDEKSFLEFDQYDIRVLDFIWSCLINTLKTKQVKTYDSSPIALMFCDNFVWMPKGGRSSVEEYLKKVYNAVVKFTVCFDYRRSVQEKYSSQ
jgi:hypothetical protein